jgi:hypothetical protein
LWEHVFIHEGSGVKRFFKVGLIFFMGLISSAFLRLSVYGQPNEASGSLVIARVRYGGGGDWYNDPSAIPNMSRYIRQNTNVDISSEEVHVSMSSERLFVYPILFMTGHGRVVLEEEEISRLRKYLLGGGFLYADDDYGMDAHFRSVMKKVFPEKQFVELPFSHPIYHNHYRFVNGLPKIHEHDNKPPQGFGLFDETGRLMVYYTYETNLSDGWADPRVHNDPTEKREAALRMGVNIILYALMH